MNITQLIFTKTNNVYVHHVLMPEIFAKLRSF